MVKYARNPFTGTRSSTEKWGPLSSSGATRSFALSTGSVSKPDWARAVITVAPMMMTVIIAMDESMDFTSCGPPWCLSCFVHVFALPRASSRRRAGGPMLCRQPPLAASIFSFTASRLKLAPFCIGGYSMAAGWGCPRRTHARTGNPPAVEGVTQRPGQRQHEYQQREAREDGGGVSPGHG